MLRLSRRRLSQAFVSTRGTIRRAPDRQDLLTAPDAYLDHVARRLDAEPALQSVRWVEALAEGHDVYRRTACLNLDPGEGVLSRRCRALLKGDHGVRDDRRGGCDDFREELEATVVAMARRLFGAGHAEWRSGGIASARRAVLSALARPNDVVVTLDGHAPDAAGPEHPRILTVAPRRDFGPDLARLAETARRCRPRAIVVGGADAPFGLPMAELRAIADGAGAWLVYNADQLGVQIAAGDFQRPLEEGADLVIVATHGALGGPTGALVLTDDAGLATRLSCVAASDGVPDEGRYAALAVALGEMQAFGHELALRMAANALALAQALREAGLQPLFAERGYTATHQLFLRATGGADEAEARCGFANIRLAACALPGEGSGERRTGLRLGVHELSRRGMGEVEMREVARMVTAAVLDEADADRQISAVADLLAPFSSLPFSFDAAQ
jgi:glycine hydroxymethyltransferase